MRGLSADLRLQSRSAETITRSARRDAARPRAATSCGGDAAEGGVLVHAVVDDHVFAEGAGDDAAVGLKTQ